MRYFTMSRLYKYFNTIIGVECIVLASSQQLVVRLALLLRLRLLTVSELDTQ